MNVAVETMLSVAIVLFVSHAQKRLLVDRGDAKRIRWRESFCDMMIWILCDLYITGFSVEI